MGQVGGVSAVQYWDHNIHAALAQRIRNRRPGVRPDQRAVQQNKTGWNHDVLDYVSSVLIQVLITARNCFSFELTWATLVKVASRRPSA